MNNSILFFIKKFFPLNENGILIAVEAFYFVCFIICIVVKKRQKNQTESISQKLFNKFVVLALFFQTTVLFAFELPIENICFYLALSMFSSAIYSIILLITKTKKQKENVKKEIAVPIKEAFYYPERRCESLHCNTYKQEQSSNQEIDFSHVKNVIERMAFYNLSPTDKRQIRELKESVHNAETEGFTQEKKETINDGLSALLKIMGKHGI